MFFFLYFHRHDPSTNTNLLSNNLQCNNSFSNKRLFVFVPIPNAIDSFASPRNYKFNVRFIEKFASIYLKWQFFNKYRILVLRAQFGFSLAAYRFFHLILSVHEWFAEHISYMLNTSNNGRANNKHTHTHKHTYSSPAGSLTFIQILI